MMVGIREMKKAVVLIVGIAIFFGSVNAQEPRNERPDLSKIFGKKEIMIPMRDGVKLHTEIYTPREAKESLPFLMERSPYGISAPDKSYSGILFRYSDMWPDGYIFVLQDIRGRYGSEGQFAMNRPVHDPRDPKGIDESTDTYDTIEWLVKNVLNNNGRVGVAGISYGGFLAAMAMINPHPALKAVSEQACMGDAWMGDDFFHHGAFRLSYGFEYSALMETSAENYSFKFDRFDLYDWYLQLGVLSNVNKEYFHGKIPTWNNFTMHPSYDDFWKEHAIESALENGNGPQSKCCRVVGSGRFLRSDAHLCESGKIRRKAPQLSGGRAMESRRLGGWPGKFAGRDSVWFRYGCLLSAKNRSALVCLLVARQGFTANEGSAPLSNRQRHVDELRFLAAARGTDERTSISQRTENFRSKRRRTTRPMRLTPT